MGSREYHDDVTAVTVVADVQGRWPYQQNERVFIRK